MSDVGIAPPPASAPAPAPAPAPNEVPINPNPVTPPSPVSNQAPDKPVSHAERGRESIQKAFAKAREENPPKPRVAKIGDNNPPEETKVERAAPPRGKPKDERPEPIDLRKRPTDQQELPLRERGEHGHFAPREKATDQRAETGAQISRSPVKELPPTAKYRDPPQRMTEAAKADWHATPETVRGDMHRMQQEFSTAYQKFRGDHETMNTIRPFDELAKKQGTNLNKALINYVSMETKLRNDVVGGLDLIVDNLNLRHDDGSPQGRKLTLQDVAWHIINQTPEQRQMVAQRNAAAAQKLQLDAAQRRIANLEKQNQQAQYERAFVHTRGAVDQYAQSHPRLDELGDLIEAEVKLGFDLDTAYRRAELLRPATHAAQTRTDGTAPQTRTHAAQTRSTSAQTRTDRSISGAPSGSNGAARPKPSANRRDAIANAIKRVGGSL